MVTKNHSLNDSRALNKNKVKRGVCPLAFQTAARGDEKVSREIVLALPCHYYGLIKQDDSNIRFNLYVSFKTASLHWDSFWFILIRSRAANSLKGRGLILKSS